MLAPSLYQNVRARRFARRRALLLSCSYSLVAAPARRDGLAIDRPGLKPSSDFVEPPRPDVGREHHAAGKAFFLDQACERRPVLGDAGCIDVAESHVDGKTPGAVIIIIVASIAEALMDGAPVSGGAFFLRRLRA